MFQFLTHKEPQEYKKIKNLNNNEINNDIFIPSIKDKEKDELISDIKIIENKNKTTKPKKKEKNANVSKKNNPSKIKDSHTLELINQKSTEQKNTSFYTKLKYYFNL